MDTIFALASARGKAGVAVIRVSGPDAWCATQTLTGGLPEVRKASLRKLNDAVDGYLDEALVLCFAKGASFTGEDVTEFHLHGSQASVAAVLRSLGRLPGLRMADPGEFTRRALENGTLDLAQVEGLSDLIEAETEAQRLQALRILGGALGRKADAWRSALIRAVALLEATIDFVDEDVPVDVSPEVLELIDNTISELQVEIKGSYVSERVRDGFEVAIVGPPNVGKSTLLNALAGREAAITSEIAGTTRDVIEVRMDLNGLPVTVLDTAGLRETNDVVEGLGIERARSRATAADIRVFLNEADTPFDAGISMLDGDIEVSGKSDLLNETKGLSVSGLTGAGVSDLVDRISDVLEKRAASACTANNVRHRTAMLRAIDHLSSARPVVVSGSGLAEMAAEDLHQAIRSLDSLIGRVDVEHVLDEIFSSFCLGK